MRSFRSLPFAALVAALILCSCDGGDGGEAAGGADVRLSPDTATASPDTAGGASDDVAPDVPLPAPPSVDDMLAPGPYAIGVTTLDLVDESRPVMANGDYGGADVRALPTELWYPAAPGPDLEPTENRDAPAAEGPFPLVVYNHGFMTRPRDNAGLNSWLASQGYVVVAPEFPLTNIFSPGGANAADVTNQPDDVRFVVDHVLGLAADPAHPLHGITDDERMAFIGVSLGGMTCLLGAFHEDYVDDRVDAVAVMAPPGCFLPDDFFAGREIPLLVIHGDQDVILLYDENGPRTYDLAGAGAARYLLTLFGGTHTGFADAAAPFMDALDHPDTIGCAAIGDNESAKVEALAPLVLSFGGDDYDTLRARCHSPCEDVEELPLAQKATVQAEAMFLGVRAFLDAALRDDEAAHRFLVEVLPAEKDDVLSLAWERPAPPDTPVGP